MRTYARIHDNTVVELLATPGDVKSMFHADLTWIDITDMHGVACGLRCVEGVVAAGPGETVPTQEGVERPMGPARARVP
jgi:hypothetical protein